jgi:formate C-acetyltransferase
LKPANEGRFHKKKIWSEGLTVLNESTRKLPLVIRKALAIKKMLSEIPVVIKDFELLVGAAAPATILRKAALPEYATKEETERAAKKLTSPQSVYGHISPYYPRYLKLGLTGLQEAVEKKLVETEGEDPQKKPGTRVFSSPFRVSEY